MSICDELWVLPCINWIGYSCELNFFRLISAESDSIWIDLISAICFSSDCLSFNHGYMKWEGKNRGLSYWIIKGHPPRFDGWVLWLNDMLLHISVWIERRNFKVIWSLISGEHFYISGNSLIVTWSKSLSFNQGYMKWTGKSHIWWFDMKKHVR